MPLASHIQLPERYRVTRHIASGGMASVWEVEDLLLGRVVAVKVLGAHFAADDGARARFAREARTAARASEHPHVATIYDIGEHGEDAFIVMEYFSGGTIADQLKAASSAGQRVPQESALRWLREAASGLDHAHGAGIVHRDVKPANLLLDGQERLAVGDFGIARLADDTQMTQTGMLLGTAAYLSPEQALGQPATAASDRYALAVVAYQLLTGARPFAGGPATAQVRQHAEAQPQRASEAAPGLPAAIDGVFARALAKEPGARPPSAAALVDELAHALEARERTAPTKRLAPIVPAPPRPEPHRGTAARGPLRLSPLAAIAIAAALVGVVLAIALSQGGDDAQTASTPARTTPGQRTQTSAAPAAAEAEQPSTSTPAAAADDPAKLNDQGFELIKQGSYAEAVAPLQASVDAYRSAGRTDELGYAFALYNLGVALNRSGNPAAAVEILRERLKYPNQTDTVKRELRDAQAALGDGKPGKGNKKKQDDE